jgi:hypothetical protein
MAASAVVTPDVTPVAVHLAIASDGHLRAGSLAPPTAVSEKRHYVNATRCGPVIRGQLMTAVVGMVLDGITISQEFADRVNRRIGKPFLPETVDELVAVLRGVNVGDDVIAAAGAARLLQA